jgi:hypothetical protein
MLRWQYIIVLLAPFMVGCLGSTKDTEPSIKPRALLEQTTRGEDAVALELVYIERPHTDQNFQRVWKGIDEQALPYEKRALIKENGFRVGVVSGIIPEDLQKLINDPMNPLGRRLRSFLIHESISIPIPDERPTLSFKTINEKHAEKKHTFENAQLMLGLKATRLETGEYQLVFTPEIDAKDQTHWTPTGSTLFKEPTPFPECSWEVKLHSKECLVIGCTLEEDTLGHAFFQYQGALRPVHRLLVVRVFHPDPESLSQAEKRSQTNEKQLDEVTPIAERLLPRTRR